MDEPGEEGEELKGLKPPNETMGVRFGLGVRSELAGEGEVGRGVRVSCEGLEDPDESSAAASRRDDELRVLGLGAANALNGCRNFFPPLFPDSMLAPSSAFPPSPPKCEVVAPLNFHLTRNLAWTRGTCRSSWICTVARKVADRPRPSRSPIPMLGARSLRERLGAKSWVTERDDLPRNGGLALFSRSWY